ncbi:LysE family translocator [Thalassotalea sp. M1531]|uniref:LysE family translocator n=1 Tax=Thalassotalea algicola TaxID=2716224 RepID=A0A7Y0LAW9_9GAMM|nr:LysE family translocator [Thalassotalea algicola]NMP31164.1 LysE family translocator [Thalassotalea algicola]
MSYELFAALSVFAFVSSITPGPNNIMLMNSGANYGVRKTVPHALGVGIGFTLMIVLVGLGIVQIFDAFPVSYQVLKYVSIAYLLYLALKIAMSGTKSPSEEKKSRPMTFFQAVLFQWVNPKAWTMALTAISIYAPSQSIMAVILVAAVFGAINFPCISSWVVLGKKMQIVLNNERRLRIFNVSMALMLIGSVVPAL